MGGPEGQTRLPAGSGYLETVDSLGRRIRDPVEKLRFFRETLAASPVDAEVPSLPPTGRPSGTPAPRRPAPSWLVLSGAGVGCALAAALVLGPMAWDGGKVSGAMVPPDAAREGGSPRASPGGTEGLVEPETGALVSLASRAPLEVAGEPVPASLGIRPAGVWLVEQGPDWEQYSNGLRIETAHTVGGERRRYRVFTLEGGMSEEVYDRPVGILFHTTESHVWPLEPTYNDNLRRNSKNLIGNVARDRLYHYVIDRFGRVYRVVEDEAKANHAGHGVWQHGERIYLSLNHAFFGVAFETRWAGGQELPLTEAQVVAGRNLTAWLRHRWDIAPEMCVTHGLTSVSPRSHLVGYHVDWARGFPFAAFDLPDQYRRPAPSVLLFGFGYDADLLRRVGQPWAGLEEAERLLAAEAAANGRSLAEERRERRARFRHWLRAQAQGDDTDDTTARAEATRAISGGS